MFKHIDLDAHKSWPNDKQRPRAFSSVTACPTCGRREIGYLFSVSEGSPRYESPIETMPQSE